MKVIIVDDSRDIGAVVGLLLAKMGFETRSACSGERALLLAREFCPDVALIDLVMPGMDGFELGRRFRALHPEIKLAALTGLCGTDTKQKAFETGFLEFILKPVEMGRLQETLHRLGEKRPRSGRFLTMDISTH